MGTIETQALQSEAMSLCLGAACKLSFWSDCLGGMRPQSQAPKMALKLFVSVPCSLLQALISIDRVLSGFLLP